MTDRWRGRRPAGLAVVVLVAGMTGAVAIAGQSDVRALVVRDATGTELTRITLPSGEGFALRYRNSLYGSLVEERYESDGARLRLVELAADEPAVLEEYYAAFGATSAEPGSARAWQVAVERPPIPLPLHVQATSLGERTLLANGRVVSLWELFAGRGDTSATLSVEDS